MDTAVAEAFRRLQHNRIAAGLILIAILAAHLSGVLALNPASLFGLSQDDTLYFSSAKALAEGRGYILPSLPGSPAATKYPVLYPWLLSWVWRLNPNFPGNILWGVTLTYFFSVAAILLSYYFGRNSLGLSRLSSLAVTAFLALHPIFIFYSARLMSDVPFAALTLGLLLFACTAVRSPSPRWSLLAGLVCSLAITMRLAGVALLAGVLLAFVARKLWRRALLLLLSGAPGLAYFAYQTWFRVAAPPPVPFSASLPGWQQTWFYYTSYTAFRHLDSPDLHAAGTLLVNQVLYFVSALAGYFVSPLTERNIAFWFVSSLILATLLLLGLLREFKGSQPSIAVSLFLCYALLLLGWDYVEWGRFLLPFLPFLVVLVATSAWRCLVQLRQAGTDWLSRTLWRTALLAGGALAAATAWNYVALDRRSLAEARFQREVSLPEKLQAYDWLRSNARQGDVIIATEDGLAYLYTDRTFINPTVLLPYDVYDPQHLASDLDHMTDVAVATRASYWLITSHDSQTQLHAFERPLRMRLNQWQATLPNLFRSSGTSVGIYDLRCARTSLPRFTPCRTLEPTQDLRGAAKP
jgi:4-amino-4-deoxy-L-arabinose transferase-like glycosyltransferase